MEVEATFYYKAAPTTALCYVLNHNIFPSLAQGFSKTLCCVTRLWGEFLSTYIFLVGVEKPECKVAGLGSSSVVAQGAGVACQEITATNSTRQTSAAALANSCTGDIWAFNSINSTHRQVQAFSGMNSPFFISSM